MRELRLFLIPVVFVFVTDGVSAQFSIRSGIEPGNVDTKVTPADTVRNVASFNNPYFSISRERAERRRIRNERNYLQFDASIQARQMQFENWVGGGENNFSTNLSVFLNHKHSRNRTYVETFFDSRYGLNVIEGIVFKNDDYFKLNPNLGWNINDHWSYTASVIFQSQYTDSYRRPSAAELEATPDRRNYKYFVSTFMAPGTLKPSLGLTYKNRRTNENLRLQLNPITGNILFVLNDSLSAWGRHGIEPGKKIQTTLGSSVQLDVNYRFIKQKLIWRNSLYFYTNYNTNTLAEMSNWLDFRLSRYITVSTFVRLIYNDMIKVPNNRLLQANYHYGLGLSYNFKNKDRKQ